MYVLKYMSMIYLNRTICKINRHEIVTEHTKKKTRNQHENYIST